MSVTIGLWSEKMLQDAKDGDGWLRTLLMNQTTYSREQLSVLYSFPETEKHYYLVVFTSDDEPVKIGATSDEMAMRFITAEYLPEFIESVYEVVTTYKEVWDREDGTEITKWRLK